MTTPKTREEVIAISNKVADEWGIPRALLLACGIAESNLRWNARRPASASLDASYWPDVSAGVWQQAVRYDPEYTGGNAYPGPAETERILQRQYDVERSAHVAAENLKRKFRGDPNNDADILRALYSYNWPAGGGRPYTPEHEQNYRRGLAEARTILGGTPVAVTYNANEPTHPQDKSFDCSQDSLEWALHALGRKPADNWMEPTMIAEGVMSEANGLEDASGAGLAAFVGRHWGEFGFYANNEGAVSFDDVANEGTGPSVNGKAYPLLIGGRAWGHWSGVRGYDAARGVLLLANPSDGYKGVGQVMSRAQWANLGPFSMVRVLHPDLLKVFEQPPTVPEPPIVLPPAADTRVERIRAKLREALAIAEEPAPV